MVHSWKTVRGLALWRVVCLGISSPFYGPPMKILIRKATELPDDDAVDGWDECQCCKEEKRSTTIWPDRPRGRRVLFAVSSLPCLSAIIATSTFPADWTAPTRRTHEFLINVHVHVA